MAITLLALVLTGIASASEFFPPESLLVQPIPRNNTNSTVADQPPCGGVPRGLSHTLAEPGSINPIAWSVKHASDLGNCTLRLGHGDLSRFQLILPVDVDVNEDGKFECGREETYMEKHVFELPPEFTCDECTLQWSWETEVGTFYQCVDVQITRGAVSACFGKCRNGGACVNDQCACVIPYTGTYCDSITQPTTSSNFFSVFILFILVLLTLLLVAAGTFLYVNNFRVSRSTYILFKRYQPWCLRNPRLDYWDRQTGELQSPHQRNPGHQPDPVPSA